MKAELPTALFQRVERRVGAFMWFQLGVGISGSVLLAGFFHPWVFLITSTVQACFLNGASFVVIVSFRPIGHGGTVPLGPLGYSFSLLLSTIRSTAVSAKLLRPSERLTSQADDDADENKRRSRSRMENMESQPFWRSKGTPASSTVVPIATESVESDGILGDLVFDHNGRPLAPRLLLGVSIAFLRAWSVEVGVGKEEATVEVSRRLVAPLASLREDRSAVLSLLSRRTPSGAPAVGRATHFVSHAQSCSFMHMLEALESHVALHGLSPSRAFAWLDLFVLNQANIASELPLIGMIERAIGQVVLVIEPWSKPVCLTRVW